VIFDDRSAREAENLVKKALEKGEVMPKEARFDSNCITPGTEFMAKLQEQLQYFVVKKISTDRLWQGVRVFLSGHEVHTNTCSYTVKTL
jgi:5'-3' exoribonuclease 1